MDRDRLRALAEQALCEVTGARRVTRLCPRCGSSAHGLPRLIGSVLAASISYADDLALIAWGPGPVGIDVEPAGPQVDGVGDRLTWTRTEALLKAGGLGVGGWSGRPDELPVLPARTLDVWGHVATLAGDGEWTAVGPRAGENPLTAAPGAPSSAARRRRGRPAPCR